ncbi:hypothetical protein F4827_001207 [Paraburkholderia bannensis]|uniref:DUF2844 domain-containing protein n=1 Tax=Paraburkholderia bannensis TaxID=765414 RepID=A0A7W9TTU8_9BURK|nr:MULTISPECIES: DUF2844 domain-containing protein [Paraburkholderia]MBB3256374.1 hypothetical protein [Paraburkholderia sp. WP4_3_2]MBB6101373.1 hypothetical protein [Paraburkholderia bannensis]
MTTCSLKQAGRAAALACLASALAAAAMPAWAALGDIAPSRTPVSTGGNAGATHYLIGSTVRVTQAVDAGGTLVREYVATASGEVFAYTWQGPSAPDLYTLLGHYADDYQRGALALHIAGRDGLHAARVDTPGVIVESGGLMRSYVGRAWLPGALPAGVTEGDLR